MGEDRWARIAALAGVLFVVLVVVSGVIAGSPPKLSDSSTKIFRYFTDHRGSIQLGSFLGGLAAIPGFVWLSALWRRLRTAEDGRTAVIAVAGFVLAGAVAATSAAVQATSAVQIRNLGPGGAKFFFTLSSFIGGGTAFGIAIVVGATAVATLRNHAFPQWFGIVSAVLAVASVVAGLGSVYAGDGPQTIGFVVLLVSLVWILVTVWLLWSSEATATPTPAAAASS